MREPRIIILDIETLPDLNAALEYWCRLSDFPGKTLKASITSIICFGYKVYGEEKAYCINAWDFPEWQEDINNDKPLLQKMLKVLDGVDAIVTHNGKRFDYKHIQTRLMKHKLPPLPKIIHIDTCQIAKTNLYMLNNKLNTISKFLTKEKKMENGGWELWVKVHKRIKSAQKKMAEYCKQDVIALEAVFKILKPFVKLPNYNLFTEFGAKQCCPNCGGTRRHSHGWVHNSTTSYRRLRCKDCSTIYRCDHSGNNPRVI